MCFQSTILRSRCTDNIPKGKNTKSTPQRLISSKPQLNQNSTQPNITLFGLDLKMTLQTTLPSTTHTNLMSVIYLLLLTWFWRNCKGRLLGTSRTVSDCHSDICPGDIYPYQEYLSCYWPDFDETLKLGFWEHLEQIPAVKVTFVKATFVHRKNISGSHEM